MRKCATSPDGKHSWKHPRQEASIDHSRVIYTYCEYCYKTEQQLKELLFGDFVSIGVSVEASLLESILQKQNPTRKRRGGMGLGIFANVSHAGQAANLNLRINADSQYSLTKNRDNETYSIIYDRARIAKVRLSHAEWTEVVLSTGRPIADVIQQHTPNHLTSVIGPTRCVLFDQGTACSFCQLDGSNYLSAITTEEYLEAIQIAVDSKGKYDITFTSGLLSSEQFWNVCSQLCAIKQAFPNLPVAFECQPPRPDQIVMLHRTGIDTLMVPLDCYNQEKQDMYLPGKKHLLDDSFWTSVCLAVLYFGAGNVTSNLIVGLDPIEDTKAAIGRMTFHGIVPELIPIRPYGNTNLGETNPEDMLLLKNHLIECMQATDLVSAPKIRSGCAACGGCSAGFTANAFLSKN